jgi:hypothetical protein
MTRTPDVEIYIACKDQSSLLDWLKNRFQQLEDRKVRGMPKNSYGYQVLDDSGVWLPVVIIEKVVPGFCSLWFDTDQSPWQNDAELADHFHQQTGLEIRYSAGGWQEGDEPDAWMALTDQGLEQIDWKS